MTEFVLTEAEIPNDPVMETPPDNKKSQTKSRLNLVFYIVLGISAFFQLIAMFTPGWLVVTSEIDSGYASVYYSVRCVKSNSGDGEMVCSSKTYLQSFQDSYDSSSGVRRATEVLSYNLLVRYQLNIQFSWFIAAAATIFQVIRYIKADRAYPRLLVVNLMAMACACCAMYQVLFEAFANIDFILRSTEDSERNIGFCYSVLLYSLAFVQTCASTVVIVKQLFDYIRSLQTSISESKVKFDTMEKKYEADKECFRQYQDSHRDCHHLRPRSRASYTDERPVSGNHSASYSPRPSPRQSPLSLPRSRPSGRTNAGCKELSERSRDRNCDLHDCLHDRSLFPDEHSHRPSDHSSGQRGHSARSNDHSPRPRGQSPRPRDYSPRQNDHFPGFLDQIQRPHNPSPRPHEYDRRENEQNMGPSEEHRNSGTEESSTSGDHVLNSNGHPEIKGGISKEKHVIVKGKNRKTLVLKV